MTDAARLPQSAPSGLIALLTAITALGSISVSLYVPALPEIAQALHSSPSAAKTTLIAFLIPFAATQLIYGPLSDQFGRRPLILAGAGIYVLGSIACMLAPSLPLLVAARMLQACGASAGPALGRAVVRDTVPADRLAAILAIMATAIALSPTIGPVIGGAVASAGGWRATFALLTTVGIGLGALLMWRLPETGPAAMGSPPGIGGIARAYASLLGDRCYVLLLLCGGLLTAGNFAWVAGAPFVFITRMGFTPASYGLVNLAVGGGYAVGAIGVILAGRRFTIQTAVVGGTAVSLLGGVAVLIAAAIVPRADLLIAAMSLYALGMGVAVPSSAAGALGRHPEAAGAAAAMLGGAQIGIGACGTLLQAAVASAGTTGIASLLVGAAALGLMTAIFVRYGTHAAMTGAQRMTAAASVPH